MTSTAATIKSTALRYAPGPVLTQWLLAGIVLASFAAKLLLIRKGEVQARSILDMEYGFGPVIRSLYEHGSLEACGFATAQTFCGVAGRMPMMPWLYATAGKLIGLDQVHLAVAKTILCSLLLWAALGYFGRVLRNFPLQRLGLVALSALLFLGPQYLKHSVSVQYEESLLIDFFPAYFLALGALLVKRDAGMSLAGIDRAAIVLMVLLGSSLYFLKSSLILFALVAILAPLLVVRTPAWAKAAAFVPLLLGLVWWGGVNYAYHGQVRLGSSYNGENLYRGQNPTSYRIYPEMHLDRLIDADEAVLNDGERVPLPGWNHRYPKYKSEWEWNDQFQELAKAWMRENPAQAAAFTVRKAYVFFVEPRKVPFRQSATPESEPQHYSKGALIAGTVWISVLRVLFFVALALALRELWKGPGWKLRAVLFLLFVGSYAAPYLIGFAYQRHITPYLVFSAIFLLILTVPMAPGNRTGLGRTRGL